MEKSPIMSFEDYCDTVRSIYKTDLSKEVLEQLKNEYDNYYSSQISMNKIIGNKSQNNKIKKFVLCVSITLIWIFVTVLSNSFKHPLMLSVSYFIFSGISLAWVYGTIDLVY